jgi:hypothetical protein
VTAGAVVGGGVVVAASGAADVEAGGVAGAAPLFWARAGPDINTTAATIVRYFEIIFFGAPC